MHPHYFQFKEELPKLQAAENYPERIRAAIRKDGFSVQAILADPKTPVVAYTIGLVEAPSHSEFIVLGDDYGDSLAVLHGVAKMVKEGLVLTPHSVVEGIIDRPVRIETVDQLDGFAVCPVFRWIYPDQSASVQFLQLHMGVRRDPSKTSYDPFPLAGKQDVKSYRKRIHHSRLVK